MSKRTAQRRSLLEANSKGRTCILVEPRLVLLEETSAESFQHTIHLLGFAFQVKPFAQLAERHVNPQTGQIELVHVRLQSEVVQGFATDIIKSVPRHTAVTATLRLTQSRAIRKFCRASGTTGPH